MAISKTEVISVRVPPDVKKALATAAKAERRSLASMVEVMVLGYCGDRGLSKEHMTVSGPAHKKKTYRRPRTGL
jgi:hypothetical protein